jgi:hypothetical protein
LPTPTDDGQNAAGAVVLTYHFWRAQLHSDPGVIGKTVRLESYGGARSATVVGVLEPSVPYPVATEIIANVVTSPHHLSATMVTGREHRMTEVFARLAPGATVDGARAELHTVYSAMLAAHPEVYKAGDHFNIDVTRMHDQINSRANTILWVLFAASGLLFVMASSNVANLVLARTVRREPELTAQGARRADGQDFRAKFRTVSPGFFDTFGVPIQAGRDFNDGDKDGSERVVIISQSLAQLLYPGQNALNRKMWWTDGVMKFIGISGEPRRIVAVMPDFDDENIIPSPAMTVYQPINQEGWNGRLFVRAHQDAYGLVPATTQVIHQMSADQPVEKASTLGDVRAEVLTPDRLNAIVFGGFATVALLISVVGVAGVLAFSVSGRTREFGIRMALGALPRHILTNVLTEGAVMAGIGVGTGAAVGFVLVRIIDKYVEGIHQPGALAFIASAAVILAAAIIASAVPAARTARVNAVEALRSE